MATPRGCEVRGDRSSAVNVTTVVAGARSKFADQVITTTRRTRGGWMLAAWKRRHDETSVRTCECECVRGGKADEMHAVKSEQ